LKEGGRTGTQSLRQSRARATLVMLEIALSVVLATSAGLLIRSFTAMLREQPGFEARGLIAGQVWIPVPNDPRANRYLQPVARAGLARELLRRLGALPDVEKVAVGRSNDIPFLTSVKATLPFSFTDGGATPDSDHAADFGSVSPTYFETLGIPLREGRLFTDHDGEAAPGVVVVNDAFVRAFSAGQDPIGRPLHDASGREAQIIGVVADVRDAGLDAPPQPHVYRSIFQAAPYTLAVFLRTTAPVSAVEQAVARTVHDFDPGLPVFGVRPMPELMAASMARRRFALLLMSLFAAVALLLAACGIYGVMAFVVGQRRQEFGVRLALGARPHDIVALVFRPSLTLTSAGVATGVVASAIVTRLMAKLLFGVSPGDPLTFAVVPALLAIVALGASLVPARRAATIQPSAALRTE
jgi:putative ABC transport system permease protein